MSAVVVPLLSPYARFVADLEVIEREAERVAKTCEQAVQFAVAIDRCWDEHGFYGAWRWTRDEAWQRVMALAVRLPEEHPMVNPWGVR